MMNSFDILSAENRLNLILEKISKEGIDSLENIEKTFLKSYSTEEEEKVNQEILDHENTNTFLSDDGNFIFKLDDIQYKNGVQYINGVLIVPDMIRNKRTIKGELKGSIIIISNTHIAVDFHRGKYDIFEFVDGLEYELDCFIDDIANIIEDGNY